MMLESTYVNIFKLVKKTRDSYSVEFKKKKYVFFMKEIMTILTFGEKTSRKGLN